MHPAFEQWAKNRFCCTAVLMITYSAQSLLITASQNHDGYAYDPSASVLFSEMLKLALTLFVSKPASVVSLLRPRPCALQFALPAVLYAIQNRLVFGALQHLLPSEYQVLNNLKLISTAVIFRVAMQKSMRLVQWLALCILSLGMVLATSPDNGCITEARDSAERNLTFGVCFMLIMSLTSAIAGVSNEYLVKKSPDPDEASLWLYVFGVLAALAQLGPSGLYRIGRFEGFTASVWLVVLCNAVLGQSVAFLLRFADSIVKLYAVCCAMGFTALLTMVLFGIIPRLQVVIGYLVCGISMCLYYAPISTLTALDSELFVSDAIASCGLARDTLAAKTNGKHANGILKTAKPLMKEVL